MKIKTGVDIIEVERIKKAIESSDGCFLKKVYTDDEIKYCNSKTKLCYEHFAARFAAKEAGIKALSDLLKNKYELGWKDIEVINNENGKPKLIIHKKIDYIKSIDVSVSHINTYAIANVVILVEDDLS